MCNECGNNEETICRIPIARILERNRTEQNFVMYFCLTTVASMLFGLFTHDVNPENRSVRFRNGHLTTLLFDRCSLNQCIAAQAHEGSGVILGHFIEFLRVLLEFAVQQRALEQQAGAGTWVWNVQWQHLPDVVQWLAGQGCPLDVDNEMCCFWIRAYMQGQAAMPQPPQPPQPPPPLPQLQQLPAQPPARPHPSPAPMEQQLMAFAPPAVGAPAPMNNILVLNTGPLGDLLGRGNHALPTPPADIRATEKALGLQRSFLDNCRKMNEAGASKEKYYARLQKICRSMEKLV